MALIVCGWCGHPTEPERCGYCGRDPSLPWQQRDQSAPVVNVDSPGRPSLDAEEIRRLYSEARRVVVDSGRPATVQAIADQLDRSPRTVRAWRAKFALE